MEGKTVVQGFLLLLSLGLVMLGAILFILSVSTWITDNSSNDAKGWRYGLGSSFTPEPGENYDLRYRLPRSQR